MAVDTASWYMQQHILLQRVSSQRILLHQHIILSKQRLYIVTSIVTLQRKLVGQMKGNLRDIEVESEEEEEEEEEEDAGEEKQNRQPEKKR